MKEKKPQTREQAEAELLAEAQAKIAAFSKRCVDERLAKNNEEHKNELQKLIDGHDREGLIEVAEKLQLKALQLRLLASEMEAPKVKPAAVKAKPHKWVMPHDRN